MGTWPSTLEVARAVSPCGDTHGVRDDKSRRQTGTKSTGDMASLPCKSVRAKPGRLSADAEMTLGALGAR